MTGRPRTWSSDAWRREGIVSERERLAEEIRRVFADTHYPGDPFLQGSFDGCEPFDEVDPFKGKVDRFDLQPEFLDRHYGALSFFSEGGFRYFLPAYLIADVRDDLKTADPIFHLTRGFHSLEVDVSLGSGAFVRRVGGSELLNPRRFGAITVEDYARFRLSVFTRDEAAVIVDYLRYRRDIDEDGLDSGAIDVALERFWLARARTAHVSSELEDHLRREWEYLARLHRA